jgi:hypothetical protein
VTAGTAPKTALGYDPRVNGALAPQPAPKDPHMKLKLLALSALAALALGAGVAEAAESPVAEAKTGLSTITPTTPQVAYPPKCGNPIFPRYCRRW